ncbi:MAG: hypothetical protein FWG02_10435 [Holophagaceae bacterium]|nr:hypothetical protein [Holophagaceae bacterium]
MTNHTTPTPHKVQRGDGKIGFIITLIIVGVLVAAGIKLVPAYLSNNKFITAIEDIATQAGRATEHDLLARISEKAHQLKITEAQAEGAIKLTRIDPSGTSTEGTCNVTVKYTRNISLYGVTTVPIEVNKTISKKFLIL